MTCVRQIELRLLDRRAAEATVADSRRRLRSGIPLPTWSVILARERAQTFRVPERVGGRRGVARECRPRLGEGGSVGPRVDVEEHLPLAHPVPLAEGDPRDEATHLGGDASCLHWLDLTVGGNDSRRRAAPHDRHGYRHDGGRLRRRFRARGNRGEDGKDGDPHAHLLHCGGIDGVPTGRRTPPRSSSAPAAYPNSASRCAQVHRERARWARADASDDCAVRRSTMFASPDS